MQHFLLQRNVNLFVSIAGTFPLIVEWPHERIHKEYPDKPLRIQVVSHHGAVRNPYVNVQLIENVGEVGCSFFLLKLRFFLDQPFAVLWREIVVGISEKGFGGHNELGIRIANAKRVDSRWRGHGVDVRIVGVTRMSMMIEDGNFFNLRKQSFVELLHIRSGQGARLTCGEYRKSENRNQNQLGQSAHEVLVTALVQNQYRAARFLSGRHGTLPSGGNTLNSLHGLLQGRG